MARQERARAEREARGRADPVRSRRAAGREAEFYRQRAEQEAAFAREQLRTSNSGRSRRNATATGRTGERPGGSSDTRRTGGHREAPGVEHGACRSLTRAKGKTRRCHRRTGSHEPCVRKAIRIHHLDKNLAAAHERIGKLEELTRRGLGTSRAGSSPAETPTTTSLASIPECH